MNCSRCKSENTNVQVVNEYYKKKGHGCILTLLFGIFYWAWLVMKWIAKYAIYFGYQLFKWVVIAPIKFIISLFKKERFIVSRDLKNPAWLTNLMRKANKSYNQQKSIVVCQSCGHQWAAK